MCTIPIEKPVSAVRVAIQCQFASVPFTHERAAWIVGLLFGLLILTAVHVYFVGSCCQVSSERAIVGSRIPS